MRVYIFILLILLKPVGQKLYTERLTATHETIIYSGITLSYFLTVTHRDLLRSESVSLFAHGFFISFLTTENYYNFFEIFNLKIILRIKFTYKKHHDIVVYS